MPTLTSLLARDSVVSLDVIEQALQRQVLEGGELDTALLELSAIADEDLLARYRAMSFELPVATRAMLAAAESSLRELIPLEVVQAHRILPVSRKDGVLVVASAWPPPDTALANLAEVSGATPVVHIGTEARVQEALARAYGLTLSVRFRRLLERIHGGALSIPPAPFRVSRPPAPPPDLEPEEEERESWQPGPDDMVPGPSTAVEPAPSARDSLTTRASSVGQHAAATTTTADGVRVVHVVKLGSVRPLPIPAAASGDPRITRPSRPGLRAAGKLSSSPRGPLTRQRAVDLLDQAADRDRVLDAFFSFARQYFACTVLFAVRDDQLLGLEASGLPSSTAPTLEVAVPRTGSVHAVISRRTARVVDLSTAPSDRALVEALGRTTSQPSALIPIAIRKRIVAVLYGDRGGEALTLNELWELLHTLPVVSAAFERIIKQHKLQAVQAKRASGREARAEARRGSVPPPERTTDGGIAPPPPKPSVSSVAPIVPAPIAPAPIQFAQSMPAPVQHTSFQPVPFQPSAKQRAAIDKLDKSLESNSPAGTLPRPVPAPLVATPASYPPPSPNDIARPASSRPPQPPPLYAATDPDFVNRPTVQLATEALTAAAVPALPPAPPALHPPERDREIKPATSTEPMQRALGTEGGYRFRGVKREQETTRPSRPSKLPKARTTSLTSEPPEPPSPQTLSHPPPGTGKYSQHGQDVSDGAASEMPSTGAASEMPSTGDASSMPSTSDASSMPSTRPPPSNSSRRSQAPQRGTFAARESSRPGRTDPRSDGSNAPRREVITIPQAVRESLRPPPERVAVSAPIVVNLGEQAERLVDDLCRATPDDEKPIVTALLRVGEVALPLLQKRFPGPLWFDRHKPRQHMPQGRDLSAIARALHAFGELAVPYVSELLASPAAETRLCATLFSAEPVRPGFLWPLYQRLFDPDGQVRLIATETIPLYRNVEGFNEILKSLRERAANEREAIAARLSALEALFILRDPNSVELLSVISGHRNRQLSVPAHRALVAITGQDFGDSERRWKNWFEKQRARHRIEWLIDGLMHGDERVRTTAGLELQKLTQVYYGFVPGAGKREREQAQSRYRNWWMLEGRRLFA